MSKTILFDFGVNRADKTIHVTRSFNAPVDLVWAAWTEAEILDQWWAPKPWKTETRSLHFQEGGRWHYCMVGPEGERHWCLFDYQKIEQGKSFSGLDAFCDEQGNINSTQPRSHWENSFTDEGEETTVQVRIHFDDLSDLETIIQMGFKEGFTMGLENLDQYIASQFYLRRQNRTTNKARVSTYVNFPGNTEEAFSFYQSVFKTAFINGIRRFGDIPPSPDAPPVAEGIKNMVLHVELPLLNGHVLMGTDAPIEMGFTVTQGNNMHINLEPDSREEAARIFHALSDGGNITMPLQDMFWGAYYGSCTDKYGINWMINHQPA